MPPNSMKQPTTPPPSHCTTPYWRPSSHDSGWRHGWWLPDWTQVTHDAFIEKVSGQGSVEGTALISAGTAPLSLFQVLGKAIDNPLTAAALANAYDVPPGDHDALVRRLRDVTWIPPYRLAPFVGHMAGPFFGDDLRIHALGFRDERQSYVTKPERTVRIFITGGSTAWGSGALSQKNTIAYVLEQILNERAGRATGYHYEVLSAG